MKKYSFLVLNKNVCSNYFDVLGIISDSLFSWSPYVMFDSIFSINSKYDVFLFPLEECYLARLHVFELKRKA